MLCGIDVFARVFELLDPSTVTKMNHTDGDRINKGETVAVVSGDMRVILSGERTALNYLGRMCGIATATARMVSMLAGTKTVLLDTRKTTPNNRLFEKYAVRVGGARNHRYCLSDGILLKDNHIGAAGGVKKAVEMAREYAPFVRRIEVETENIGMVIEALEAGADIIMLDNMDYDRMAEAIALIAGRAKTECSGNFTPENVESIRSLGADFVSCGALTHSVKSLDLSLKNMRGV